MKNKVILGKCPRRQCYGILVSFSGIKRLRSGCLSTAMEFIKKNGGEGEKLVNEGRGRLFDKPHAHIRITGKRKESLGNITAEGIRKEGCETLEQFQTVWKEINGFLDPGRHLAVCDFELVPTKGIEGL